MAQAAAGGRQWGDFALLAVLSLGALAVNGYTFGLDDHAIHLAFLLRAIHPHFLESDPLVQAAATHPSLFWMLQAPLVRTVPIELVYLVLHLLSLFGTLAGVRALTRALWPGPVGSSAARLAPLLVIIAHVTLTRVPTMDATVLNRTVVLPLELYALARAVERRYLVAALLCGLAFDLHATSALQTFALVLAALLCDRERRRRLPSVIGLFALAAAPLLVVLFRHPPTGGVPSPVPADWISLTIQRSYWHHYASLWSAGQWLLVAPPLVLLVLAVALAARRFTPELRALVAFLTATVLLCACGYLALERLHQPWPLELHLWQSTRMLDFLAAAMSAGWMVRVAPWRLQPTATSILTAILSLAVVIAFAWGGLGAWMLPACLALLLLPKPPPADPSPSVRPYHALALAIALIALARLSHGAPLLQTRFDELRGARVSRWARAHLPDDALVAVPPLSSDALAAFRYGARRALFGTFKDGGEASFNLTYARIWKERMEALCNCRAFEDVGFAQPATAELADRLRRGYDTADGIRLHELSAHFGVTHAITAATRPPLNLPLEYEDDEYRLYRVSP